MVRALRHKLLDRVFGQGAGGFLAASLLGWLIDQAREAGRSQPERLDTARLVPGETYLVTTRPPMSRAEAKTAACHASASAKLEKMSRPSPKATRVARKLSAAQRKAAVAPAGSARQARHAETADRLGAQFDQLTAASDKQRQLQERVDELGARLEGYRSRSLEGTRRRSRPRTTVFR